ncbi:MAG: hypothetical protein AABY11_02275 [archaeon]
MCNNLCNDYIPTQYQWLSLSFLSPMFLLLAWVLQVFGIVV